METGTGGTGKVRGGLALSLSPFGKTPIGVGAGMVTTSFRAVTHSGFLDLYHIGKTLYGLPTKTDKIFGYASNMKSPKVRSRRLDLIFYHH